MMDLLRELPKKEQRGSRARAIVLTHGPAGEVTARLERLAVPGVQVDPSRHEWAPRGFLCPREARLGDTPPFLSREHREIVSNWWLAVRHPLANTPNWDIVSQATIGGRAGLILVEGKAYGEELSREAAGKACAENASEASRRNHVRIGCCIREARRGLSAATGLRWSLSRRSCYQMANRFAWAWKLATLGIPVVLVYLGFLNAEEMRHRGSPFGRHEDWEGVVRSHGRSVCPDGVWERPVDVGGVPLIPLIRSTEVPLAVAQTMLDASQAAERAAGS